MSANSMVVFLLEMTLKVTVLSFVAIVFVAATRRRTSASIRNGVYALALGAALLTPVAGGYLRTHRMARAEVRIPGYVAFHPVGARPAATPLLVAVAGIDRADARDSAASAPQTVGVASRVASPATSPLAGIWPMALLGVYGLVAGALLMRSAIGFVGLHRLAGRCDPVEGESPIGVAAKAALENVGVQAPVRLLLGPTGGIASPLTWGVVRPTIALPAAAADWPEERLRSALLHEAAHIRRTDFSLLAIYAPLSTALYWFHPLVWILVRLMRTEGERACDDVVLTAGGVAGVDYARHLLDVARIARNSGAFPAVAMAQTSAIEGRVRAILDVNQDRRRANGPGALLFWPALTLALAFFTLPGSGPAAANVGGAGTADVSTRPAVEDGVPHVALANGATVRILGVLNPFGKPDGAWWLPDGKPIASGPMNNYSQGYLKLLKPGDLWRSIATEVQYSDANQPREELAAGVAPQFTGDLITVAGEGLTFLVKPSIHLYEHFRDGGKSFVAEDSELKATDSDDQGRHHSQCLLGYPSLGKHPGTTEIDAYVAAGAWSRTIVCPVKPGQTDFRTAINGVKFLSYLTSGRRNSPSGGVENQIAISAGDSLDNRDLAGPAELMGGYDRKLIAVDRDGHVIADIGRNTGIVDRDAHGAATYTVQGAISQDLMPRVAKIVLLTRPYQRFAFRDIRLSPRSQVMPSGH